MTDQDAARRTVDAALDHYGGSLNESLQPSEVVAQLGEVIASGAQDPVLLVEQSNINGEYQLTVYTDQDSAFVDHSMQECAEDWDPVEIIYLRSGTRYPLFRTYGVELDGGRDWPATSARRAPA